MKSFSTARLKEALRQVLGPGPIREMGILYGFWAASMLLWELTLHVTIYGGLSWRFLLSVAFSLAAAAVLTVLSSLLRRGNILVQFLLVTALLLGYGVHLVYYRVFGVMLSLVYVSMGGQAVGGFLPMVLGGIGRSLGQILVMLLPYAALAALHWKGLIGRGRRSWRLQGALAAGGGALLALSLLLACLPGVRTVYLDPNATVDRQAEYFGILTATGLELRRLGQGGVQLSAGGTDLTGGGEDGETVVRNILPELDFEALDAMTDDPYIHALDQYFAGLTGTGQHEYTGLFEGCNLIEICAEAFSPYLIDPERTPTLYRLSREGIVFQNFYNSFPSLTTNGEYSLCMGLMPDTSRLSFATSMDNYMPFCLGNRFREAGLTPLAYHNNIGTFYNRVSTHTNMGYDFRAIGFGLEMERQAPSSDLEMMEASVDDYIHSEPFVVHYMTYSGHAEYDFTTNAMAIKNQDRVADLDCSEPLRAYYACQLELEDAMTYLVGRLEEAGIAERTVIVLTTDHYPYGLPDECYQELAGEAVREPFWRYKNSLICWKGGMEEPIIVEDYCCGQDVLPTLLDLFALPYDSRLLTGRDIFSDSTHMALLLDGSFRTEALDYDAAAGKISWKADPADYPADYPDQLVQAARNSLSVSASILRTDYYRFAFESLGLTTLRQPPKAYASYLDTAGTWYEDAVEQLTGRGAIRGTASGEFNGGWTIDRGSFLTILTRALYLEAPTEADPPYADLAEEDWYYPAVTAAWASGLLPEEEACRPTEPLTPEDAESILAAAAEQIGIEPAGPWAAEVMEDVVAQALTEGEDVSALTRGAAAVAIAQLADRL